MNMIQITPVNIESLNIEVKGRPIHYLKSGKGAPVVLLHGGASNAQEWRPVMEHFGERFSFYAPDLPGFGQSTRDPKGYYLDDFSEFLLDFINSLKMEKPALAGHSLGGRICLDVAVQAPDRTSKLILIDASGLGSMSAFGSVLFYFFKYLRDVLRRPQPFPKFLAKEGVDWNKVGDEALKKIKVPTLFIWKSIDPYLSVNQARHAVKIIPGAKLEVVKGYGHAPHQQKDKSEFFRLMEGFLQ
jgi:pimeloyl-ACP methyl ester carboxylesterase